MYVKPREKPECGFGQVERLVPAGSVVLNRGWCRARTGAPPVPSAEVLVDIRPMDAVAAPATCQFLRGFRVALNKRGYHASGTVMVRPSRKPTLEVSS